MIWVLILGFMQHSLGGTTTSLTEDQLAEKLHQYQSITSLEASFKQTKTIKDMAIEIKSEGRFSLTRPRQVKWEIIKPSPVVILLNDKEMTIRTGKEKDLRTQTLKYDEMPSDKVARSMTGLMAWLDLNAKDLYRQYEVFPDGPKQFKFVPREKASPSFRSLNMTLSNSGHVEEVHIVENSGDFIDITFGIPKIVTNNK